MTKLVTTTYAARQRLIKQGIIGWSLAILVPTKKMTRLVSDALRQPPAGLTDVPHATVIEMEAAILAAEIIALLLQPAFDGRHFEQLISLMCNYFQGKDGAEPTQTALKEAAASVKPTRSGYCVTSRARQSVRTTFSSTRSKHMNRPARLCSRVTQQGLAIGASRIGTVTRRRLTGREHALGRLIARQAFMRNTLNTKATCVLLVPENGI